MLDVTSDFEHIDIVHSFKVIFQVQLGEGEGDPEGCVARWEERRSDEGECEFGPRWVVMLVLNVDDFEPGPEKALNKVGRVRVQIDLFPLLDGHRRFVPVEGELLDIEGSSHFDCIYRALIRTEVSDQATNACVV